MTQAELERILAVWQERLRLGHWDIRIRWEIPPDTEKVEAEIHVHGDYDQASIRVCAEFERWDEQIANTTIVHELLHIYERGSKLAVEAVALATGALVYEVIWNRYEHESEAWIDRLAAVLVALGGYA